jgi:hypothetical protein
LGRTHVFLGFVEVLRGALGISLTQAHARKREVRACQRQLARRAAVCARARDRLDRIAQGVEASAARRELSSAA